MTGYRLLLGDCRETLATLPAESVQCVVTSPPYFGLRDYGVAGQLGLEPTPTEYIDSMLQVFREVWRVLRNDGTLWLNMGDSYAGSWGSQGRQGHSDMASRSAVTARQVAASAKKVTGTGSTKHMPGIKAKDMIGMPWRLAFALQEDGWYLRQDIIWYKPNPMPESVRDRCTKAHEYLFLLSKSRKYYYDAEAIKEPVSGGAKPRKASNGVGFGHGYDVETKPRQKWASPVGWDTTAGEGGHGSYHKRGRRTGAPGCGPKSQNAADRVKANDSFHSGTLDMVSSRNKRSVWEIPTAPFKGAHFATFPPALILPCIQAGTSERGHCPGCGKRWERLVSQTTTFASNSAKAGRTVTDIGAAGKHVGHVNGGNKALKAGPVLQSHTDGWAPCCKCGLTPVPDVVLDPFGGSGTTAGVANVLGRKAILCELSAEYSALVPGRIEQIKHQLRHLRQLPLQLVVNQ